MLPEDVQCSVSCTEEIRVEIQPLELEAVLVNLVTNARDAMPDGGAIAISLRQSTAADAAGAGIPPLPHAVIGVRDNGRGMSTDVLRRATEPFFTTKQPGQGSGLGLALARDFAVSAGGKLRIESTPDVGTLVEIFLLRAG